jgi:hypothetical protein
MTLSSSTGCVTLSLNQVQMTIDTADYPTAQTKAKAIREKSQAFSREIETALAKTGKGKPSTVKKKSGRLAVCPAILHD